jgi:aspartate/methionine/tyrosine aminotransferase
VRQLLDSSFAFDIWVPKGSHFIIADISGIEVKEKYFLDEKGNRRTKDYAFAFQLAHENRVICIPCSPFYDRQNTSDAQRYVRFAFCKSED